MELPKIASGDEPQQNKANRDKANKERVLEDAEDNDNESDHEPMTLHLPDGNDSNDSDDEIDDKVKGSNEDDKYSDEDEDEDGYILSIFFLLKCNLLNLTIF